MKEQKEPQEFAIHYTEKHHAEAFIEDMKKQGYNTCYLFYDKDECFIGNRPKNFTEVSTYIGTFARENTFTLPEQWKEALDFTAKQMQLYKELQKPKNKSKEDFLKAELNVDKLTPLQWSGILRAMDNFADQETKKEAAIRVIEAIGTTTTNKSKEQQLYEYFADNHDIQLLPTDIQEFERIFKEPDLCECGVPPANFLSNVCWKCKKFIY